MSGVTKYLSRVLVAAIVLPFVLAAGGCAWWEDVHIFSTAPKNKPAVLTEFTPTLAVKPLWNANVGKAGRYFFSPAMIGPDVVIAGGKGVVERRVLATGVVVWKTDLDVPLAAGVGSDGNVSAVATVTGDLIALDTDGKPLWRVPTNTEVLSAPAVGQGVVVVRTTDNRVIAYDLETGRRRWIYARTSQPLVLRSNPGMALDGGLLFAGFPGGKIAAINVASGTMRWEASVAVPKGSTELERVADVVGTPVVVGREVCAAAFQGRAGCFDVSTGNTIWIRDMSTSTGIEIDGRFAFVTDDKSNVNAITRTSGATIWKTDKLAYRRLTAPASVGRAIVVGDYRGFVHWLSREDGSLLARSTTDGSSLVIAPRAFSVGSAPAALFQTPDGNVYAFVAE
ncbi:MAG: outer membrane protein assembly factor BamB [Burkholderiaceae bacterium]